MHRPAKRSKPGSCSCLTLKGGTDAAFAPPIGYLQHVFLPTLKRLIAPQAADLSIELIRRGFYPKGGGEVQVIVPALPHGTALPAFDVTQRGHLVSIRGYAVTAGKLRADVCQRMATAATRDLKAAFKDPAVLFGAVHSNSSGQTAAEEQQQQQHSSMAAVPAAAAAADGQVYNLPSSQEQQHTGARSSCDDSSSIPHTPSSVVVDIQAVCLPPEQAVGDGGSLVLVAETSTGCLLGASALAERGVAAEALGAMAARDLLEELRSGAAVDSW